MQLEWNEEKAKSNLRKHGIGFDEAKTVWDDYFYIDLFDNKNSVDEKRFLIIGESNAGRLLIVS